MSHVLKYRIPDRYVRTPDDVKFLDKYGPNAFDISKGERVCRFVETYLTPTLGPGAGQPVELLDWQRHDYFIPLFSYVYPETGNRRFIEACVSLARQNGKSLCGAGTASYMFAADGEPGATCVIVACTGGQVKDTLWTEVHNTFLHPDFKGRFHVTKTFVEDNQHGSIKPLSSDGSKTGSKLGKAHHCYILDEFAFWNGYTPYTSFRTAINKGTRKQPLLLTLSSAGRDRSTPAYERIQFARGVMDGSVSDFRFFPLVYETKETDPIDSVETWKKANPSLGYSVSLDGMEREAAQAARSKASELEFRQYALSQWVNTLNQWVPLDAWERCTVAEFPNLTGKSAYMFIDHSTTFDLSSVVTLVPFDGRYWVEHHSWCSADGMTKRLNSVNMQKYDVFEQEGYLTVHSDDAVYLKEIRQYVRNQCRKYRVKRIGIDPSHNASDTMQILADEGYPIERWGKGPQYWNTPMRRLVDLVSNHKIAHKGDALINWQARNLEGKADTDDRVTPTKPNEDAKIDTMICLLGCIGLAVTGEVQPEKKHGVIEVW